MLIGLGVVDHVMEAAPGALEGLEILMVHDEVDLLRELLVNLGDHRRNRPGDIGRDEGGRSQGLLGQRAHGRLDGGLLLRIAGLEFLVEQRLELADFRRSRGGGAGLGNRFPEAT